MKDSDIRRTEDAIHAVFAQFGVSKRLRVEEVNGLRFVKFWALHRGEFLDHWARIGYPLLRAGSGRLAGSFAGALQDVARAEANELRSRGRG